MELGKKGRISITAAEALAILSLFDAQKGSDESAIVAQARKRRKDELKELPPHEIVQQLGHASSEGLIAILTREIEADPKIEHDTTGPLKTLLDQYRRLNV